MERSRNYKGILKKRVQKWTTETVKDNVVVLKISFPQVRTVFLYFKIFNNFSFFFAFLGIFVFFRNFMFLMMHFSQTEKHTVNQIVTYGIGNLLGKILWEIPSTFCGLNNRTRIRNLYIIRN